MLVTGVKFNPTSKVYYFDPGDLILEEDMDVIVETARGLEFGKIAIASKEVGASEIVSPLRKVIRIATEEDYVRAEENVRKEQEAYAICEEKILANNLEMKLVEVQYAFDGSKIIFFFTADGRVDFRELVKDLAAAFRTRIELRQIGVRDEAKMIGGLGPCGRELCCTTYLTDFIPVSIKMAKTQNLTLNPTKISGVCGRLMCCLRYENDHYEETNKLMPRIGAIIETPEGSGEVLATNAIKETVTVAVGEEKTRMEFKLTELPKNVR